MLQYQEWYQCHANHTGRNKPKTKHSPLSGKGHLAEYPEHLFGHAAIFDPTTQNTHQVMRKQFSATQCMAVP